MLSSKQRKSVYVALVALFALSVLMAASLGPRHEEYLPRQTESQIAKTPFQALVPALLGFREIMASLLWIKTDDYFHEGEYRPIIRLVKLITTIDPHQLDVYATGAWHMAYNFMDKRLIDEGLAFLAEGVRNNPSVYDLYFESGYTNYDKTHNFPAAINWFRAADTKVTSEGKPAPAYVGHELAHSYERAGLIDDCVRQWKLNLEHDKKVLDEKPKDYGALGNYGVSANNYKMTLWRINDRRDRANDRADLQLAYTVKKMGPRKLMVEGTCTALDYSRMTVILRDKDWKAMQAHSIDWRMANQTLEWDSVQVRGGKFHWILDLNKDPADMGRPPTDIYPLKSDQYELVVRFDPRVQAVFIQDRYGWSGEGLTDAHSVVVDPTHPGVVEGKRVPLRYVEKTTILRRKDIV